MKKSKLTLEERKRINFYRFCMDKIKNNPLSLNYVCQEAFYCDINPVEYLEFRDILILEWMHTQVYSGGEIYSKEHCYITNEYRIFILQLCIEMIKNK